MVYPGKYIYYMAMIRKLNEQDFPDVLAIEAATQFTPWTAEVFTRCLKVGYEMWGVHEDGHVIAFVVFSTMAGEGHILNLCVYPSYQRRGYGRQLLIYALEYAKQHGVDMMLLEVRRSNHSAIRLYHQEGFSQIGERNGYYPAPNGREDALIYAKDLRVAD